MPKISYRSDLVVASPIRRIAALLAEARRRKDIISFGGGAPSLEPPKELVEEAIKILKDHDVTRPFAYGATKGILELRETICADLKKYGGIDYNPDQVIVTEGATEGIYVALSAVLDKGDEVILMDPTYLGYSEPIKLLGGKIVRLPVYIGEDFQPSLDLLSEKISDKTKAIMILSPDNPTGRVIREDIAKGIVDLACDHDFWIIADDTYKHIIYEGKHVWISALENAYERTITVCTFSKSASLPGLRLGYVYGPEEAIECMERIKQYLTLCPNTFSQMVVKKFLEGELKERYIKEVVVPTYMERRNVMGKALEENLPDATINWPAGAFYFFVDISNYLKQLGMDDEEFANRLLEKKSVVVIPGKYFGENGRNHVRLTFVSETNERIVKGVELIAEFIRENVK